MDEIMYRIARRNRRLMKMARKGDSEAAMALPSVICEVGSEMIGAPTSELAGFDGAKAMASFVVSTKTKDSYGDIIHPEGCLHTISRYNANPVVAFNHDIYTATPIGTSFNKEGQPGVTVVPGEKILADVVFHLKTQLSEQTCALVDAGELRGASIGLLPDEFTIRKGKRGAISEDEEENVTLKRNLFSFYDIQKWTLYEWSVVGVPANPDCVRLRLEKGIGGRALDPQLVRTLTPFLPGNRVWSRGYSFARPKKVEPVVVDDAEAKKLLIEKKASIDAGFKALAAALNDCTVAAKSAVKSAQKITGKIS